jgi:predicted  nucleic acid-binding Zn-ribbon protein
MQEDFELLKARRGKLDDEGLASIEAAEEANAALAAAREGLRRTEALWQAEQEELLADKARAEAEAARLLEEREKRAAGMEKGALGLYEKLRSLKQGRGVSRVERGACQGCRISLPTHIVQRVRAGNELVQCTSCERILVGA